MKDKKKEFEAISVTKIPTDAMQILRDNNIKIASYVRDSIVDKAKELSKVKKK